MICFRSIYHFCSYREAGQELDILIWVLEPFGFANPQEHIKFLHLIYVPATIHNILGAEAYRSNCRNVSLLGYLRNARCVHSYPHST